MVATLQRGGHDTVRQRGSHVYLRHPSRGGLVTVPVHGNDVLDLKVVKSVLAQAGLGIDELKGWL